MLTKLGPALLLLMVALPASAQIRVDIDPFLPGNFFSVASQKPSLVRPPVDPVMSDDVPTLDQVRLIPSLKGEQNKKVSTLFELYRAELKPLQSQLKDARKALSDAKKIKPTKNQKTIKNDSVDVSDVTLAQLQKAESDIVQTIKERRLRLLNELKTIVSTEQLTELQKIRRGELIGE